LATFSPAYPLLAKTRWMNGKMRREAPRSYRTPAASRSRRQSCAGLGPPVVGGRCARLDIVGDDLPAPRRAVVLRLAATGPGWRGRCRPAGRSRPGGRLQHEPARSWHLLGQWRVENNSSNRSPNLASKTSISASVTGNPLGPIILHGPCLRLVHRRSARPTRWRTRVVVQIVRCVIGSGNVL
jgi:hypothetical protein